MRRTHAWALVACICLVSAVALSADTLVLRDGRRIQGRLIGVRDGTVEFEAQRGRERMRVDESDVARIEFDQSGRRDDDFDRDRDGDRDRDRDDRDRDRPGRPSGLREREVTVNASEAWRDTGISVRAGQTIYFRATGRVRWGPGRQDGPEGEHNSARNNARPIPSRPAAALIGRVGDSNDPFFIGDSEGPIRVRDDGRLFLGINDDYLRDNSGSFRVTVYY